MSEKKVRGGEAVRRGGAPVPLAPSAPLFDALCGYADSRPARFHMPGHQASPAFCRRFGASAAWDVTELPDCGDLLSGTGAVRDAERLCADALGAADVRYGTCGATAMIQSMVYAVKGRGTSLALPRRSHLSVFNALRLAGIAPVVMEQAHDAETGRVLPVSPEDAAKAASRPGCIGVLVTAPAYDGSGADIAAAARLLHADGRLLLVDAAHGSHLAFLHPERFQAADMAVFSFHKTLPVYTGGAAAALYNGGFISAFADALRMFHSSSPSYLVLASMDRARADFARHGGAPWLRLRRQADALRRDLSGMGYTLAPVGAHGDFARLTVCAADGYGLAAFLRQHGVVAETADGTSVTFILTPGRDASLARLQEALRGFDGAKHIPSPAALPPPPIAALPFLDADAAERERVPLQSAAGRISASEVGLYPPGTPLILRGERFTKAHCAVLSRSAGHTFGLPDGQADVVVET